MCTEAQMFFVKTEKIQSPEAYQQVMQRIELLLQKSSLKGGFDHMLAKDVKVLKELSILAESYEEVIPKTNLNVYQKIG